MSLSRLCSAFEVSSPRPQTQYTRQSWSNASPCFESVLQEVGCSLRNTCLAHAQPIAIALSPPVEASIPVGSETKPF